ncbi:hypothetical protein HDU78_000405, partial [Chytriomyces hyalinus]
ELADIQPHDATTTDSYSKTGASKTSQASLREKTFKMDETSASQAFSVAKSGVGSMSQTGSGVRWDAEDYTSHDDLKNATSMDIPPVPKNPLRKSLTSPDRNKKRGSILNAFRPFSWGISNSGGSKPALSILHSGFEKGAVSFSMSDVEMGKKADPALQKAESLVYELKDSSIRINEGSNPTIEKADVEHGGSEAVNELGASAAAAGDVAASKHSLVSGIRSNHGSRVQLSSKPDSIKLRPKSTLAKESHLSEYTAASADCSCDAGTEPPVVAPPENVSQERPSQVNWRKVQKLVVKSHSAKPNKQEKEDIPQNAVILRTASMLSTKKEGILEKTISRSNIARSLTRKKAPVVKKTVEPVHQDFEMASTRLQRWFLCKAFDDKGVYLAYEFRQVDSFGDVSFSRIGLHPMSMANAISGSVFIAVYLIMIFTEPYCASFSGNDDLFSGIVWT